MSNAQTAQSAPTDQAPTTSPVDLEREDLRRRLKDLLGTLSKRERLIVILYYFEQLSAPEIALTLDLPEAEISAAHVCILDRLRAGLELPPRPA